MQVTSVESLHFISLFTIGPAQQPSTHPTPPHTSQSFVQQMPPSTLFTPAAHHWLSPAASPPSASAITLPSPSLPASASGAPTTPAPTGFDWAPSWEPTAFFNRIYTFT